MKLNIIVCIKSVMTDAPKGKPVRTEENSILNPFDRPALEMALRLREKQGGVVTALSMGPAAGASALYEAMAMGVDRGILASARAFAGADTLATSTALAAAIKKMAPFDLALFGTRTVDSDTGHVGPQVSVLLGLPMVTGVKSIRAEDSGFSVDRTMDGYQERFSLSRPAVLTIHPRAVQPRDVGLPGIGFAFDEKKVERWSIEDLGLSAAQVGDAGSPTRVLSLSKVKKERKCEFIEGEAQQQADLLIKRLVDDGLIA